jgi:hypothetical protein
MLKETDAYLHCPLFNGRTRKVLSCFLRLKKHFEESDLIQKQSQARIPCFFCTERTGIEKDEEINN